MHFLWHHLAGIVLEVSEQNHLSHRFFREQFSRKSASPGTAGAIFNAFIVKLENVLNTTRTEINFTNLWNSTKPLNATAPSLRVLLNTTYADLITLDQIQLVADPFIDDYKASHGGRMPFINPTPLVRWGYGRTLPSSRKAEALTNKTIFMDWFGSEIVKGGNDETCSESIFLYPQSSGGTNYRNTYIGLVDLCHLVACESLKLFVLVPQVPPLAFRLQGLPYTRRHPTWSYLVSILLAIYAEQGS